MVFFFQFAKPVMEVDISGDGFNLTGIAGGVYFDLDTDGTPQHMG